MFLFTSATPDFQSGVIELLDFESQEIKLKSIKGF